MKLKLSSSYHPETDGSSECTNKTVIQALRYHVDRNQLGWCRVLPLIRFNMMNSVSKSTGFSPFQLRFGRSPRVLPPLIMDEHANTVPTVITLLDKLMLDTAEAQDNLLKAKISQSIQVNKRRQLTFPFRLGDRALLTTVHRRHEYKSRGDNRVAKFMPRFDGPYLIIGMDSEHSTVTLDIPDSRIFNTFHTSQVVLHHEN